MNIKFIITTKGCSKLLYCCFLFDVFNYDEHRNTINELHSNLKECLSLV
jgi:hypothetical protein